MCSGAGMLSVLRCPYSLGERHETWQRQIRWEQRSGPRRKLGHGKIKMRNVKKSLKKVKMRNVNKFNKDMNISMKNMVGDKIIVFNVK